MRADPITVDVTLDQARATTTVVSAADGGTLTATGADGTVYTLEIPANTLPFDPELSLVPVEVLDGQPFSSGIVGAVELQPHDVVLMDPATLTVTPPAPVPASEQLAFAFAETGELHLFPTESDADGLVLPVVSFGGYGIARGVQADLAAVSVRWPTQPEAQFLHAVGHVDALQRIGQGGDVLLSAQATAQQLADRYLAFLGSLVPEELSSRPSRGAVLLASRPLMLQEAPVTMCSWAIHGASKVRMFRGQLRFIGPQARERLEGQIDDLLNDVIKAALLCYDGALGRCVTSTEPASVLDMWDMDRVLRAAGADLVADGRLPKFRACFTFELEFESTITYEFVNGTTVRGTVKSTAVLQPPEGPMRITVEGDGLLDYVSFEPTYEGPLPCRYENATATALTPFRVLGAKFPFVPGMDETGQFVIPDQVEIRMARYQTRESVRFACQGLPLTAEGNYVHSDRFHDLHSGEFTGGAYVITNWEPGNNPPYLRRKFEIGRVLPAGAGNVTESTTFTLTHTPT